MRGFLILAIVGLAAQLVDGALGMAYGTTSQSLLLVVGLTPALASASVHMAEVGTTLASGVSHWRFGNVDWSKVLWLAIPGGIGAFLGAVVLSSVISAEAAEPIVAVFLFCLGIYILARFAFRRREQPVIVRPVARGFLGPLGLVAGFLDAADGGGGAPARWRRSRAGGSLHRPHPACAHPRHGSGGRHPHHQHEDLFGGHGG